MRSGANFQKEEWAKYFQRIVGMENHSQPTHRTEDTIYVMVLDHPIDTNEIRGAIGKLKTGKAPGSDGISVEFLMGTTAGESEAYIQCHSH